MKRYRLTYETKSTGCSSCRWLLRSGVIVAKRKPTDAEAARMMREKWRFITGSRVTVRHMDVRVAR